PLSFSGERAARGQPAQRSGLRSGSDADVPDRDVLDVEVLVDALRAALAAVARLLDAAERRRGRGDDAVVGADDPVLELLGHAQQARVVLRVEVRGQAVD